ncbi:MULTISPECIES: hypothetical protein [Bacillus cereus group]|uniref:hypothetical protein n=1 Tax=Bacillus cereus group TaxID=86661 RepID=UPI001F5B9F09|nr:MULTISPECIES: hypothetical protein [Bacillus cereus group]
MFDIFKKFKGTNHELKIESIQFHDPIDKMVEKEMAQLKAIKDEKEQDEMSKYKKQITSLEELHQIINALETLKKEYQIIRKIEWSESQFPLPNFPKNVWYVEEVNASKVSSDCNEIVKLVCNDCGTSFRGERKRLEERSCIYCFKDNTKIVLLDKE